MGSWVLAALLAVGHQRFNRVVCDEEVHGLCLRASIHLRGNGGNGAQQASARRARES